MWFQVFYARNRGIEVEEIFESQHLLARCLFVLLKQKKEKKLKKMMVDRPIWMYDASL